MDSLIADGSRDNLHRAGGVITPGPYSDLPHAAAPGWKQRCVPSEEPVGRERLIVVPGGVEHHLDDALDVAVRWL